MKVAPYTPEELQRILAFKMPHVPVGGKCDWCGGAYTGRPSGPHICTRCWANRAQIRRAIAVAPVDERAPDPAPDDASSDCSANIEHRGRSP